jgi:hypothetical protein
MQSFLSKLKLAMGLITKAKGLFRQASISSIKADGGILVQFLNKTKFSIKLMAEVSHYAG